MSNNYDISDEELEKLERIEREWMDKHYEKYIKSLTKESLDSILTRAKKCIEETTEKKAFEVDKAFDIYHQILNRVEAYVMVMDEKTRFDTLMRTTFEIAEDVRSSIYLVASGEYKSAMILIRRWLEMCLTAAYFDSEIGRRMGRTPAFFELKAKKMKWLKGDETKRTFVDYYIDDAITILLEQVKPSWYVSGKTLNKIIKRLYIHLSKVVHYGAGGKIDEYAFVFPLYNDEYFNDWYKCLTQTHDITSLVVVFKNPQLLRLSEDKWAECFDFNKNVIQDIISL